MVVLGCCLIQTILLNIGLVIRKPKLMPLGPLDFLSSEPQGQPKKTAIAARALGAVFQAESTPRRTYDPIRAVAARGLVVPSGILNEVLSVGTS